jgi:hypothetical protein
MDEDPHELLAELDLGPPRTKGNVRRAPAHIEYVRDLTEADMAALQGPRGVTPKSLLRIHASHHALARCIAAGMKPHQAALVTGYDEARISVLSSDPAFTALVADYQAESRSIFADLAERMNNMSLDAMELLQARMQEKPEEFTPGMLLDVVKTFADRTGHGPGQSVDVKMSMNLVDRPPRESFEDWENRRRAELEPRATPVTSELSVPDKGTNVVPWPRKGDSDAQ